MVDDSTTPTTKSSKRRQPLRKLIRAWLLLCPRCGKGKLFAGLMKMLPECNHCRLNYEREPGFYLGAIYLNYGLTSALSTVGFMVLRFGMGYTAKIALGVTVAFSIVFPLLYFRHARSLWLSFDQLIDPQ